MKSINSSEGSEDGGRPIGEKERRKDGTQRSEELSLAGGSIRCHKYQRMGVE